MFAVDAPPLSASVLNGGKKKFTGLLAQGLHCACREPNNTNMP